MRKLLILQVLYTVALGFLVHMVAWVMGNLSSVDEPEPLWYAPSAGWFALWPLLVTATYPVFWALTLRRAWGTGWVLVRGGLLLLSLVLLGLLALFFFAPWLGGSWT